ncbi:glycosyltransferase, partial [Oribacterium parvum]|uniref:glycosyltransferase n=1 Tax=Oribacterium parvum TaxID=1501329 RepID=UPI0028E79F92
MQIIVLCTYNGEKYLREQIQSLLTQDYSGELLLLLSDDGSTDGTREILQKTKEECGEKVFLYDKGEVSGSAWKHFLMILSALANQTIPNFPYEKMEYIFLSDQDDLCFPDKISALTEALQEAEKRYGKSCPLLCHSDMEVIDEGGEKIADSYFCYQKMPWKKDSFSNLLIQNHVTGAAIGINQSLLSYLKKRPDFVYMHDQWIALLAAAFGHITVLPKALYAYRQHGNNVLGAKKGSAIK